MVGLSFLAGGLALGLTSYVSAGPLAFNTTSYNSGFNTTATLRSTSTVTVGGPISTFPVVESAAAYEHIEVAAQIGSVASAGTQQDSIYTVTNGIANAVQPSLPTGFQKVVVTETVAGCLLGAQPTDGSSATSLAYSQAPFALAAPSSTGPVYSASTLLPAVHWDHPIDDIRNLAPSNSSNLYYGNSDPSIEHLFASISATTTYESVVLDHSSFVSDVSCTDDGILISFTSTEAFTFASDTWTATGTSSGFVLVTYTDGCHGSSDEQRTFWLINSLELLADSLSILASVDRELAIEDALHEVQLEWGTWKASNNSTNGNSSRTSGSDSSGSGSGPTNSTANGSSCGNAPSAVIDGLPAANCGDANFDKDLDNAIGYLDFSSSSVDGTSLSDFLPDATISANDLDDAKDGITISRRALMLEKRWNPFKAIARAVTKVAKAVVQVYTAPIRLVATAIRHIPVVGDFIAKTTEFDPSISGDKDFNFGPTADTDSPWGKAAQIYSKSKTSESGAASGDVTVFCVDCGVKGHVALSGQAKFNILDGLHGLNAAIDANLIAGVNLGLVAHAQYSDTKSKALVRAALPEVGVAVKGVFSAGVYLSVDAVSTIDIAAEGQVLVGVIMTIPNFQAKLNLFDQDGAGKSSISGLNPTFEKRFEASAQVDASLRLALPIAINCGFEIPALSLKRAISLIEQPSLYGKLTAAGSTSNSAPASQTCNNGLEYFANFQNDVNFDFLGIKTFNLNHYDSPPLLQGCKSFGPKSSSSSLIPSSSIASSSSSTEPSTTESTSASSSTTTDTSSVFSITDASSQTSDFITITSASSGFSSVETSTDDSNTATPISSSTQMISTDDSTPATSISSSTQVTSDTITTAETPAVTSQTATDVSTTQMSVSVQTTAASVIERRTALVRRQNDSSNSTDTVIANDVEEPFTDDGSVSLTNTEPNDSVDDYEDEQATALSLSQDEQNEDGITFTTLVDVQQNFYLVPGEDGNLYAGQYSAASPSSSALFAQYDNIVFGDDGQRVLHFYPDEMAVYNVSRIRLSSDVVIPKTADAITLSPIDYDQADSSNPTTYFAVTTKQDVYSLVLCNFNNGADSKVFIVNDQSGLDTLKNNGNIVYTVTGAPVQDCYPLAMVSGGNGTASAQQL